MHRRGQTRESCRLSRACSDGQIVWENCHGCRGNIINNFITVPVPVPVHDHVYKSEVSEAMRTISNFVYFGPFVSSAVRPPVLLPSVR